MYSGIIVINNSSSSCGNSSHSCSCDSSISTSSRVVIEVVV